MTASGNEFTRRKVECEFRKTRIDKDTRTSGGGKFYDHCALSNRKCVKKNCIFNSGGE